MADVKSTGTTPVRKPRVVKPKPSVTEVAPVVAVPVEVAGDVSPQPIEEAPDMTNDTVMKTVEAMMPALEKASANAMAQAKVGYEDMNAKMAELMEKNMKSMNEMTEFAKGNLEAMIASAKAATAGAEQLTAHMVETSKKSFEEAQEALKAMTAAKTPNEMLALQNDFAKAQFEKTVATWSQLSEAMLKVSGEVFQPLSSRMALATETVKKTMNV